MRGSRRHFSGKTAQKGRILTPEMATSTATAGILDFKMATTAVEAGILDFKMATATVEADILIFKMATATVEAGILHYKTATAAVEAGIFGVKTRTVLGEDALRRLAIRCGRILSASLTIMALRCFEWVVSAGGDAPSERFWR